MTVHRNGIFFHRKDLYAHGHHKQICLCLCNMFYKKIKINPSRLIRLFGVSLYATGGAGQLKHDPLQKDPARAR